MVFRDTLSGDSGVWIFEVVEPQKTSDHNKYGYVLRQIPSTADIKDTHIMIKPPEDNKYEAIKQRFLSVYEQSEVKNFKNFICRF